MNDFLRPSDMDRAENEELNRVCEHAEELQDEVERLQMQLVACGVVAMANTRETATKQRDMHPDYMSASCQDVMAAVDREMALREERDQLKVYQAELVRELTSCQSVLFMLARSGEVTPAYADDAKAVLDRKPEQSLATHDAEVIERAAALIEIDDSKIPTEFDFQMCRGYRVGFTHSMCSIEEVARQIRQQAKEQNDAT